VLVSTLPFQDKLRILRQCLVEADRQVNKRDVQPDFYVILTFVAASDTIRILVATDNHVGYAERDPVRGNDSYTTFNEIMELARERDVPHPSSQITECFTALIFVNRSTWFS